MARAFSSDPKTGTIRQNRLAAGRAVSKRLIMKNRSSFCYVNTSPGVVRQAALLYVRFPLSLCNVEDLLSECATEFSHETVRLWWNRFDPMFAAKIIDQIQVCSFDPTTDARSSKPNRCEAE